MDNFSPRLSRLTVNCAIDFAIFVPLKQKKKGKGTTQSICPNQNSQTRGPRDKKIMRQEEIFFFTGKGASRDTPCSSSVSLEQSYHATVFSKDPISTGRFGAAPNVVVGTADGAHDVGDAPRPAKTLATTCPGTRKIKITTRELAQAGGIRSPMSQSCTSLPEIELCLSHAALRRIVSDCLPQSSGIGRYVSRFERRTYSSLRVSRLVVNLND